jgi:hypothetical protein
VGRVVQRRGVQKAGRAEGGGVQKAVGAMAARRPLPRSRQAEVDMAGSREGLKADGERGSVTGGDTMVWGGGG